MKKRGKFVAAILCCALVFGTVAYASNVTKTIQAAYADIKLVIDGVPITPKDANGTVVEPFIYNGTTYLPVRAVGEAMGKQVSWDGNTKTVYIGEAPGQVTYLLDVCPPYEDNTLRTPTTFVMAGKKYSNGFTFSSDGIFGEGYALFNLNGEYSTMEFDLGHEDGSYMSGGDYSFYLDGRLVQTISVEPEEMVKHYVIPLNHALQMKITSNVRSDARYGFANAVLH